ncbi:MAG: sulfatase [Planctomycetota bacterium]
MKSALNSGCVLFLGVIACASAASASEQGAGKAAPPNLMVIIADDLGWDDTGAYGHPHIRTPNIDRLAKDGLRFDNAFLTCSSCSPSRSSIMTGRYPHATGAAELHQPLPESQVLFTTPLRKTGYYAAAAGKWHLGPAVVSQFDLVREGGGDGGYEHWLPVLRERPKDKPFFFWFAANDPHRGYRPGALSPPHEKSDVVVPPYLPDNDITRRDLALYYDEIGRLDQNVGQVIEELERQGIAENTLVLFMSDNGRPFPRCKTTLYDSGIKTPFIVRWPAVVKPGTVAKGLVSSVDIAPTFVQLAGAEPLESFQGESFAAILADPGSKGRERIFAEHNWHDYLAWKRGVRSDRYLYVFNGAPETAMTPPADAVSSITFQEMRRLRDAGQLPPEQMQCFTKPQPAEELYDLSTDPECFHNLAGDPSHAETLKAMRETLAGWQQRTGDAQPASLSPDTFDRETGDRLGATKKAKKGGKKQRAAK